MKQANKFNHIFESNSLETRRISYLRKSLKNRHNNYSMKNMNIAQMKNEYIKDTEPNKEQDDISILSNANINIIKILDTCLNEDIYNSSFIENNKDNSKDNILKDKNKVYNKKNKVGKKKFNMSQIINKNRRYILNVNDLSYNNNKKSFYYSSNQNSDIINSSPKGFSSLRKNVKFVESNEKNSNRKRKKKLQRYYSNADQVSHKLKILNKRIENNLYKKKSNKSLFNDNNYVNHLNNNKKSDFISYAQKNNILNNNNNNNKLEQNNNPMLEHLNEIEIMKINNNIHNDVNFLQLKNKISKLKKSFQLRYSVVERIKNINSTKLVNSSSKENSNEESNNKKNINNNIQSNKIKKRQSVKKEKKMKSTRNKSDKYRILVKKNLIYDSFDDEEGIDEGIDYYISPNSFYIKIFDLLLFFASIFYFIFVPYFMSKNIFVSKEINSLKLILILIDVLYIVDVIINFFRAYQNFDENLIRKTNKIILHYFRTWFFLDLIQAIPCFSLIQFFEKMITMNDRNMMLKELLLKHNVLNPLIYNLLIIKVIKVYKMLNYNSTISSISEIFSRNEILERYGSIILTVLLSISCLNMCTCLFIFLGKNSYPNWIIKLNIQDESHINIFLASLYFIIVTITTVGYGDITGDTMPEIIFQVLLLIIGTIAYSFIISYISNYIIKSNKKSMTFEKHLEILQEIKVHHPDMDNTLYQEVLRNLYNEQLYEKKDKHILFDCLPYSLKNKLIMEMYKLIIRNFVFFKYINNADFIVKVITSLKPLVSIKDDIIIQEGDFVKEIIFVKKGIISLNINIDFDDVKNSIRKFLGKNNFGKFDISYMSSEIIRKRKNKINLDNALSSIFISNDDDKQCITDNYKEDNIEQIKIIEIRNNEHFGDALMFLNDPCPLTAKVRTKIAELLILRKIEAIEIYSIYPNIWKRINKKSLYNMEQIYLKIRKIIIELSKKYNIKLGKSASLNKHIKKKKSRKNTTKEDKITNDIDKNKDNSKIYDFTQDLTFGDNNNLNLKKSMTTDKHNKSISKFSKLSNDLNTNENEYLHNNQKIEANTINTKTAKFESKTNSTKSLYNTKEINDEIYKNEIFDYNNNNQKSKLLCKKIILI